MFFGSLLLNIPRISARGGTTVRVLVSCVFSHTKMKFQLPLQLRIPAESNRISLLGYDILFSLWRNFRPFDLVAV
jgi:hypothetical protein